MLQKEIINKIKELYGDLYEFINLPEIVCNTTKLKVYCKKHNCTFKTVCYQLLEKKRCPECIIDENTERFIERAKAIHGDKFDYSKTRCIRTDDKIEIICKEHGSFFQLQSNHLKGQGCPYCSGNARMTKDEFLKRAHELFGDTYDYSKVKDSDVKNRNSIVTIICRIHGEFQQSVHNHLRADIGCPKCAGNARLTVESFIEKARKVHGDKYDYSKVTEIHNNHHKVTIICPVHGEFQQTPQNHLNGTGCPRCIGLYTTFDEFLKMAKEVYGDKYDYSLAKEDFVNMSKPIRVICPTHGIFEIVPTVHVRSRCGCPKCSHMSTEEFIEKAKEVHGDKYDYSITEYINSSTKIAIICKEHGIFYQLPHAHLKGFGCRLCNMKYPIRTTEDFIRIASEVHNNFYDYSKTIYTNITTKIIITCPQHGDFE